ncbi:hypothetical protein CRYUN_Cryun22dG0122900 [Craigia yunnanensis]
MNAEERIVQHLPVTSNLLDSGSETTKFGFGGNEQPLCPKPRRLGSAIPEFLKPIRCSKHSQPYNDGKSGVLNMIAEKFIHQMELLSPFTRTKLSDKFGITSASPV